MEIVEKMPRAKDLAAIEAWIAGSTLTRAYRDHVAANPDAPRISQAASNWARQPHIREAAEKARQELLTTHYGSVSALITAQLAKFEAIFAEGMTMRPDAAGVKRPESLPAALGAAVGITKLFAAGQQTNATKIELLKTWLSIRDLAQVNPENRENIENAITGGLGL